ncbi:hypothetical protein BP5796_07889 [Coleophoma crateriformis]|uniref:Uncharacterized protein n=1 Tax=Coleophoma crateriformis TaxID=565419 RepID=A0A3D8RCU6_9HELO|nr:hypothetical protein BP5796_07889 [Coleophoma crateriformis]
MSSEALHTPRRYRASYGRYIRLPESQSTPSIQAEYQPTQLAYPANYPSRYQSTPCQSLPPPATPLARSSSIKCARKASRPPSTRYSGWASSYSEQNAVPLKRDRRQTTTTLPNQPLYSVPTVASSSLTASASTNDLSQPVLVPRFQQPVAREPLRERTSSRIPTPSYDTKPHQGRRYVSTPVLPSEQKENLNDAMPKALRLLGPISPPPKPITIQRGSLPRSRTLNMISSLTSSLSRSTIPSSKSRPSLSTADTSIHDLTSPPGKPLLLRKVTVSPLLVCSNPRQITIAHPHSYWCGRFRATQDRLIDDEFQLALRDPVSGTADPRKGDDDSEGDATTIYRRVFIHLEALCRTKEARQSLWEYQQAFARTHKNEKLLPVGGRMVERNEWVRRLSRVLGDGYGNGRSEIAGVAGLGFKAVKLDCPKAESLGDGSKVE